MSADDATVAWLDYAWHVVNTPQDHMRGCLVRGAAAGDGPDGGNTTRYPGLLGRDWTPGRGILCLASVHREPEGPQHVGPGQRAYIHAHDEWREAGRSPESDARYLAAVRAYYAMALPTWGPWRNSFRPIIEDELGLTANHIAYGNLAKCRQRYNAGNAMTLIEWCQREHPVSDLIAALRPAAVLTRVIGADPRRGVVAWETPDWSPLVFAFQGQGWKNDDGERKATWLPRAVEAIRHRWAEADSLSEDLPGATT